MLRFTIIGGKPLVGEVTISGSKNAALPAMCAALLADTPTRLTNVPDISDVHTLAKILTSLGASVSQIDSHTWEVSGSGIHATSVDHELGKKLRASILLLGPMLARLGQIDLPHPGGDLIGKRPVNVHLEAFRSLGAHITLTGDGYQAQADRLRGAYLYLDEVSVTATENALMAAVLAEGTTTIRPAALELHVVNLCELLTAMGANIEGIGTHTLIVHGVSQLTGTEHRINSDEIETGTYAAAAAITGGRLTLTNIPHDLDPILYKLKTMGVTLAHNGDTLTVQRGSQLLASNIQVDTWPRFPTDLQPQFTVLATQAEGESLIHEWMYENRLKYIDSLNTMGARIERINPHQAMVHGPTKLHGATIDTPDIRSGIAFVLAALVAEDQSNVNYAELILRGYEDLISKLTAIGGQIEQSEVSEEKSEEANAY